MSAPPRIITSTQYGLAFQPRTGIAVCALISADRRVVVDKDCHGVIMHELLRRYGGDLRVIWYRCTIYVRIVEDNVEISDLVRIGFYNSKCQVLGTSNEKILTAIKKLAEKVLRDNEYIPSEHMNFVETY